MFAKQRIGSVLTDFTQAGEWHLTLTKGEEVFVLGEKPGWYLGSKPDRPKFQGIFPMTYVGDLRDASTVGGDSGSINTSGGGTFVDEYGHERQAPTNVVLLKDMGNGKEWKSEAWRVSKLNMVSDRTTDADAPIIDEYGFERDAPVNSDDGNYLFQIIARQRQHWAHLSEVSSGSKGTILSDDSYEPLWQRWRGKQVSSSASPPPLSASSAAATGSADASGSGGGGEISGNSGSSEKVEGGGIDLAAGAAAAVGAMGEFLNNVSPPRGFGRSASSRNSALQKLFTQAIHSGVPPELREQVWWRCSGAATKKRNAPAEEQYPHLVSKLPVEIADPHHSSDDANDANNTDACQIEKDLQRTFPTNSRFQNEEGIASLRRVLLAYSRRNPELGYCQSMNFITAMLLLHMDEESSFWMLAAIIEDLLPCEYYAGNMTGLCVEQRVLQSCLSWKLPKVHKHLLEYEVDLDQISVPWFMCLFLNSLPLDVTLRVWDCFFYEGFKALHRISLAIFKLKQPELMEMEDMCDMFRTLRSPCSLGSVDDMAGNAGTKGTGFTADEIIKTAWGTTSWLGAFPTEKITGFRVQHAAAKKVEMKELEAAAKARLEAVQAAQAVDGGRESGAGSLGGGGSGDTTARERSRGSSRALEYDHHEHIADSARVSGAYGDGNDVDLLLSTTHAQQRKLSIAPMFVGSPGSVTITSPGGTSYLQEPLEKALEEDEDGEDGEGEGTGPEPLPLP